MPSFLALWWPKIDRKSGFPQLFASERGYIVPIYGHSLLNLTKANHVTTGQWVKILCSDILKNYVDIFSRQLLKISLETPGKEFPSSSKCRISLKCLLGGQIDNTSTLVEVVAWCCQTNNMPLPRPMLPKSLTSYGIYASVNKAIIGSDNGLLPGQCQAIIWTNAGIMLIWPLQTNFSEMLIEIQIFSLKKIHLKMLWKRRPSCLCLNVLRVNEQSVVIVASFSSHNASDSIVPNLETRKEGMVPLNPGTLRQQVTSEQICQV